MKGFFILFAAALGINIANAQAVNSEHKSGWLTNNPFKTDVFIKNLGQFDNWARTPEKIKYVVNNGDNIFFTQKGLTYKLVKPENNSEEEREKAERKGEKQEEIKKTEVYYINMQWEGSNPDARIEVSDETEKN